MSGPLVERTRYQHGKAVPYVKTSAIVAGRNEIDTFHVMSLLAGQRPHEFAADLLLDAIREAQADPAMQRLVRINRLARSGLRLVQGRREVDAG